MPEVAHQGEHHGEAGSVGGFDHLVVAHRPAGLDHCPLQIGGGCGCGGGDGRSFLKYSTRTGSSVSFGQNFGARISRKQEAFQ
jgi:hypothetical protein